MHSWVQIIRPWITYNIELKLDHKSETKQDRSFSQIYWPLQRLKYSVLSKNQFKLIHLGHISYLTHYVKFCSIWKDSPVIKLCPSYWAKKPITPNNEKTDMWISKYAKSSLKYEISPNDIWLILNHFYFIL